MTYTLTKMSAESPLIFRGGKLPVFHPDQDYHVGFSEIMVLDDFQDYAKTINIVMRKAGRNERWRAIMFEDRIVAEGLWTLEETIRFGCDMTVGPDGNFRIPEGEFREESAEDSGTLSGKTRPDAVKVLVEQGILTRKGENTYYFRSAPFGFRWVEKAAERMDITASVGEVEKDGRVRFSLKFKEVKGKKWEIADRLLNLISHIPDF